MVRSIFTNYEEYQYKKQLVLTEEVSRSFEPLKTKKVDSGLNRARAYGLEESDISNLLIDLANRSKISGTPVANQLAYWSGVNALAGRTTLTDDGVTLTVADRQTVLVNTVRAADVAGLHSYLVAESAYPQAVGNTGGANLYLGPGAGTQYYTVVNYAALGGKALTIYVNGVATTKTEGIDWSKGSSNNECAANIAAAFNGVGGMGVVAVAAGVYFTKPPAVIAFYLEPTSTGNITTTCGANGQVLVPGGITWSGATRAIGLAFLENPNVGFILDTIGNGRGSGIGFAVSATYTPVAVYQNYLLVASGPAIGWSSANDTTHAPDTAMYRDSGPGIVGLMKGTGVAGGQPYVLRIYNTYASSANFERLALDWQAVANTCLIQTEKGSGGGTLRNIQMLNIDELLFSDMGGGATAAGRLRRNGASLNWHDGTASRRVYCESVTIAAADLPSNIDAAKLADGSVSNTEYQYLNGVTSAIQTQLDGKISAKGILSWGANNKTDPTTSESLAAWGSGSQVPLATRDTVYARIEIVSAGTLSKLRMTSSTVPGSGKAITFTVRKNGINSSITVTFGAATTQVQDLVNTLSVSAGDYIEVTVSSVTGSSWSSLMWLATLQIDYT